MDQKGFIQIPLFIAIIASTLVLGGVGYFGAKQYQNYLIKNSNNNESTTTPELSEVEKLRQEVAALKRQSTKDIITISTGKKSILTNAQIITKIKPATVYIRTQTAAGSGMIFSSDGYVLTNAHVVKGASDVNVSLSTGEILFGTVIGRNEVADLAVIKIAATKQLPKIEFADSDKVQQGDNVFTFGFPFGIEGDVSFKEGTISRRIESYFETSAEIHPGNSGGPLVDRYGQVIGVNTAIFGKTVGGVQLGETIKLAVPIKTAIDLIPKLNQGMDVVVNEPQDNVAPPAEEVTTMPVIEKLELTKDDPKPRNIYFTVATSKPTIISIHYYFMLQLVQSRYSETTVSSKVPNFISKVSIPDPLVGAGSSAYLYYCITATDKNSSATEPVCNSTMVDSISLDDPAKI